MWLRIEIGERNQNIESKKINRLKGNKKIKLKIEKDWM